MISGHNVPVQNSAISSLRCRQHLSRSQTGALRHDRGGPRDRVGQVKISTEVLNGVFSIVPLLPASALMSSAFAASIRSSRSQMRRGLEDRLPQSL